MANKWIDTTDPKWAHPEMVEANLWTWEDGYDPREIEAMTEEEHVKLVTEINASYREILESMDTFVLKDYKTEHGCPEEPDAPAVPIVVANPVNMTSGKKYPVIFSIGGGGLFNFGTAESALLLRHQAEGCGFDVIQLSCTYRLSPHQKYPASVNDVHATYIWILEHAEELQIDTDRIVIQGVSSGGHLALALGFRLQRYNWHNAPMPRGIVAHTPAIDNLDMMDSLLFNNTMPSGKDLIWDGFLSHYAHKMWLGDRFVNNMTLPPEALPTRATLEDLEGGYPPVWIPVVGELEPQRDPIYKFVAMLHKAHVFCELHMWGGMNHMFCGSGGTLDVFKRLEMIEIGCVKDALTYDFRRPWLVK